MNRIVDIEACGRTPEEGYSVLALALAGFRRLYGIAARPEDMPREWANVVREVRQDLQDSLEAREDLAMP